MNKLLSIFLLLMMISATVDARTMISKQMVWSEYSSLLANLGFGTTAWKVTFDDGSIDVQFMKGNRLPFGTIYGSTNCQTLASQEYEIKPFDQNFNGYIDTNEATKAMILFWDGNIPKERSVAVVNFNTYGCSFVSQATKGTIVINSVPTGAAVYLSKDNGFVYVTGEMTTPFTLDLYPGNYIITLKKAGYEDWTVTIPIVVGETRNINAGMATRTSPTPVPTAAPTPVPLGHIKVYTTPSGAQIIINGASYGTSPRDVSAPPGTYNVRISTTGQGLGNYQDQTFQISLAAGETKTLNAALVAVATPTPAPTPVVTPIPVATPTPQPSATTGSIYVTSDPSGATVDAGLGYTVVTPYTFTNLYPGGYHITISQNGYSTYSTDVTVRAGSQATVSTELTRTAVPTVVPTAVPPQQAPGFGIVGLIGIMALIAVFRRKL